MSVEATGWAFRQKVPAKPKMLLMALADQTDETTGHVCYGKRDAKHLSMKASCSERTFYRYMAALVRNGYAISHSGKAKGEPNEYYLCLDRPAAKSLSEWQWSAVDDDQEPAELDDGSATDDDAQDVAGGYAKMADPVSPENDAASAQNGRGGLPQDGRPDVSADIKHLSRAREGNRSTSFSRKAQDAEIENRSINRVAEKAGARTFVIEGSRAWREWLAYRRDVERLAVFTLPTCTGPNNNRGWYLPSLFPPNAQPPPTAAEAALSEQDMADFK